MEQEQLFKGRDKRKKGWFWLDNEYLNGYAKLFGAVGTAIYVSLCRHADNETQRCFPAVKTISEELNIGVSTVKRYIHILEEYRIISVFREKDPETKRWLNNVYQLNDKEEWIKPESPLRKKGKPRGKPFQSQRQAMDNTKSQSLLNEDSRAYDSQSQSQRQDNKETHINKTHINKTHIEEQPSLNENKNSSLKDKPTPEKIAREFFENHEFRNQFIKRLIDSREYGDEREVLSEVSKFFDYWTERNKSGTKQRWELEKTFEIGKRLKTWFNNAKNWQKRDNNEVEFII